VNKWQPLWLALCLGLAFGSNRLMRPAIVYALSPGERTLATGTLKLDGAPEGIRIVTVFVVADELRRPLADPIHVRELWLRSPEQDTELEASPPPDIELFFDYSGDQRAADASVHDVEILRDRELPLLPVALGGDARSQLRFPGASTPSQVTAGSLRILESFELESDSPRTTFRIEGEIELTVRDGSSERSVQGTFNARLGW